MGFDRDDDTLPTSTDDEESDTGVGVEDEGVMYPLSDEEPDSVDWLIDDSVEVIEPASVSDIVVT